VNMGHAGRRMFQALLPKKAPTNDVYGSRAPTARRVHKPVKGQHLSACASTAKEVKGQADEQVGSIH